MHECYKYDRFGGLRYRLNIRAHVTCNRLTESQQKEVALEFEDIWNSGKIPVLSSFTLNPTTCPSESTANRVESGEKEMLVTEPSKVNASNSEKHADGGCFGTFWAVEFAKVNG
jgi:hypothetical protein